MHADSLAIDVAAIRRQLAEQTPLWADLPMHRINSSGTDNALFRLGNELLLRLPLRESAIAFLSKELDWLPRLIGLPLAIPRLRHRGGINLGQPCEFGIFDWIDGAIATPEAIGDADEAAVALAVFIKALHRQPTEGAPVSGPLNSRRGVPLSEMTQATLSSINLLADEIDTRAAKDLWASVVDERHRSEPVWLHGDLKGDNLLAKDGRLVAVIDWGLSAVGDPAADHAAAWTWIQPSSRKQFRDALELDDGDWQRAKGWALYGAVIALSYYRGGKNEALCRQCRLTLSRLGLLL
ncbi:phosphotransferase [Rhizobium sp. NRK18]|uniref:phosphotransferase n=1 Tax=Rhizobium sp. NRK18 TaxID=2964667 RepID=UPI0021C32240|nr:phosphotransferase [Rhizobium sp. NRK18]MCQ2005306.1 phosphotransferase [Rhizobium sp. NRK18]